MLGGVVTESTGSLCPVGSPMDGVGVSWDSVVLWVIDCNSPHPHAVGLRLGGRSLSFLPVLLPLFLPLITVPDFPLGTHYHPPTMGDVVCVGLAIPHPDRGVGMWSQLGWSASFHPPTEIGSEKQIGPMRVKLGNFVVTLRKEK